MIDYVERKRFLQEYNRNNNHLVKLEDLIDRAGYKITYYSLRYNTAVSFEISYYNFDGLSYTEFKDLIMNCDERKIMLWKIDLEDILGD